MAGAKGRSGRKRSTISTQEIQQGLVAISREALDVVREAVRTGDLGTAKWVLEMTLGRPRQQIEPVLPQGKGSLTVTWGGYDGEQQADAPPG